MDFQDKQYAFLLKPIKDLTKNWEIDIDQFLSNFMKRTLEEGAEQVDFAKASFVIQGSVSVWGKKVDYLSRLSEEVLDLMLFSDGSNSEKKQRKTNRRGKKTAATLDNYAELKEAIRKLYVEKVEAALLKLKRNYHFDLARQNSKVRGSRLLEPLDQRNEDVLTNFYDCSVTHLNITSRAMSCLNCFVSLENSEAPSGETGEEQKRRQAQRQDFDAMDVDDDAGFCNDDGGGGGDDDFAASVVDSEEIVRQQHNQQQKEDVVPVLPPSLTNITTQFSNAARRAAHAKPRTSVTNAADDGAAADDTFKYLSLDDDSNPLWKDRPIKVKHSSFINFRKRKTMDAPVLPMLIPAIRELSGVPKGDLTRRSQCGITQSKVYDKEKKQRVRQMRLLYRKPRKKRALKRKAAPESQPERAGEGDAETEQLIAQVIDGVNVADDDDCQAFDDVGCGGDDDDVFDGGDAGNFDKENIFGKFDSSASAMQDSYKRLQELVDAGFKEANDRTKRSEIEKRVKDWEEGIRPYLDSYSKLPSFNMQGSSCEVLTRLERVQITNDDDTNTADADNPPVVSCNQLFGDSSQKWEVARRFASLLQLANDNNVELKPEFAKTGPQNLLKITLLDSQQKDKLSQM